MTAPAKPLLISITLFLILGGVAIFIAFIYLTGQTPSAAIDSIHREGKLFLYKHNMVEKLSSGEITYLYKSTCTRKCHGKDVIEKKLRTAAEWEAVITRMKAPDRAGITDRHADTILRYLQNNYLSNVPTVLPAKTMKFVKKYLWRMDFGEGDLFLDIIYIPREHFNLLRYLGVLNLPTDQSKAIFVMYLNTHRGSVPDWDIAEMSTLQVNNGSPQNATDWKIHYRDGQRHHVQGMLTFPGVDTSQPGELEVTMKLTGMGTRTFQWSLPVPSSQEE
ncbi:MAG TPA: hypothetical protein VMW07_01250 [Gallionella sp.]|jgi:hypothetical protein|nr:hypothetical protein [Gallionella sp.]